MEQRPRQVQDAILREDKEALHFMAVAGGKATAKINEGKAALRQEEKNQIAQEAIKAEQAHNMDAEGNIRPPETEFEELKDSEVRH